jgi:hypothetical protein
MEAKRIFDLGDKKMKRILLVAVTAALMSTTALAQDKSVGLG